MGGGEPTCDPHGAEAPGTPSLHGLKGGKNCLVETTAPLLLPPPKAPIAPQPPQLTPSATRSLLSPPVQQPPTQPCPPSSSCPPPSLKPPPLIAPPPQPSIPGNCPGDPTNCPRDTRTTHGMPLNCPRVLLTAPQPSQLPQDPPKHPRDALNHPRVLQTAPGPPRIPQDPQKPA